MVRANASLTRKELLRGRVRAVPAGRLPPPSPRRLNDRVQIGHRWLPSEEGLRAGRISDEPGGVTRSRTFDSSSNRQPGNAASCFDYFNNGVAASGAEIQCVGCAAPAKVVEGANVRIGQIGHMNVITNGGAVRSRVLIPEYSHFSLRIGRGCKNVRDEVSFGIMILAAASRGAGGVKIRRQIDFKP